MTPPNPPPPKQETDEYAVRHKVPDSMPVDVLWMAWAWRTYVYTTASIEILALLPIALSLSLPPTLSTLLPPLPTPTHQTPTIHTTPLTILAHTLLLTGTSLRLHCYALLARAFTYELSLRPDHKLITDGPYAVVRHPSYTGIFGMWVGNVVVNFGRGGWWWWWVWGVWRGGDGDEVSGVRGLVQLGYVVLGTTNVLFLLPLPYIFAKRCVLEDKVMKECCKEEEEEEWREGVGGRRCRMCGRKDTSRRNHLVVLSCR